MAETLFVYGTLRRDAENSMHEMLEANSYLIGYGRVRGQLMEGTSYPALKEHPDYWVSGEVYFIDDSEIITRVDEYEGSEYARKKTSVYMDDGTFIEAWVYYSA